MTWCVARFPRVDASLTFLASPQCGCPGCALRCCVSFPEWAKTRRLTVVPHGTRPPPYLYWGDSKEPDAARIFRALDVVKCSEERGMSESEIRRVAGGFVGAKGKGVFVERQERNWLFIKIVGCGSGTACVTGG